MGRDERIYEEATALWLELFDEPPPARVGGAELLDRITKSLADPDYDRLRSPYLRPTTITMPRPMRSAAA